MFHLAANRFVSGAAVQTNADVAALADPILTTRNNHHIFTDDFRLILAYALSATLTSMRLNAPTVNAFARHHLWPFDSTGVEPAVIPDEPAMADYRNAPVKLPQMEEIAWEATDTAGTAEAITVLTWLATPDHRLGFVPPGIQRLTIKASYAIASVLGAWTGPGTITFAENLRGGWYSVVAAFSEDPNCLAFRLIFPRAKQYGGRILRPGSLAQNAYVRRPARQIMDGLGVWGKFHSFEPPQIEILCVNAAAHTGDLQLDLVYHGESEPQGY